MFGWMMWWVEFWSQFFHYFHPYLTVGRVNFIPWLWDWPLDLLLAMDYLGIWFKQSLNMSSVTGLTFCASARHALDASSRRMRTMWSGPKSNPWPAVQSRWVQSRSVKLISNPLSYVVAYYTGKVVTHASVILWSGFKDEALKLKQSNAPSPLIQYRRGKM